MKSNSKESASGKSPTLYVDRSSFVAWTQGILLDRKGLGMIVGDDVRNERAERVLEQGGTVILTVDGAPFSRMVNGEDGYYEELLKPEDEK